MAMTGRKYARDAFFFLQIRWFCYSPFNAPMRSDLGDVWISSLINLWCKTVCDCTCMCGCVCTSAHAHECMCSHPCCVTWVSLDHASVHMYLAISPPFPLQWGLLTWEPSCGICVEAERKTWLHNAPQFCFYVFLVSYFPLSFLKLKREKSYWNDPVGFLFL